MVIYRHQNAGQDRNNISSEYMEKLKYLGTTVKNLKLYS